MRAAIEVDDRKEAELIRAGLADPAARAFVKIIGALSDQTKQTQGRILRYVEDHFAEREASDTSQ